MSEATTTTQAEIDALPKWARVAFAARCARRVLPRYEAAIPRIKEENRGGNFAVVSQAVAAVDKSAAAARPVSPVLIDRGSINAKAILADRVSATEAAAAVRAVMSALESSVLTTTGPFRPGIVSAAADAVNATVRLAITAGADPAAVRSDFDRIRDAATTGGWTDDTPVPPDVFGPL